MPMKLSVFEEYPIAANLSHLEQLRRLARRGATEIELFIAADSLDRFYTIADPLLDAYPFISVGYWPLLAPEEGYWLSPFSAPQALTRLLHELTARDTSERLLLLWDAELPVLDPSRLVKHAPSFAASKRQIQTFFERSAEQGIELVSCEYPTQFVPEPLQRALGIAFSPTRYRIRKIKMAYTSMKARFSPLLGMRTARFVARTMLARELAVNTARYGSRFGIALGCLATGALEDEPIISASELASDLALARRFQVERVYLYRLGGLVGPIVDALEEYVI